ASRCSYMKVLISVAAEQDLAAGKDWSIRHSCGQVAFSSSTNKGSSAVRLHQPSVASSCERPMAGSDEGRKPQL
ncbi:MAG: hypothetical protein ACKPHU_05890, partial [Planctomycetaceae bacterium]